MSAADPNCLYVTIVSGLPRSGTSMMMRMLEAGGMPVLTDELRTADIDNPRGYYEYEPVKKTKEDATWLRGAVGKAVKMVYQLLYSLPEGYEYRVLMMQRHVDEVLQSQRKMLDRLGTDSLGVPDNAIAKLFQSQLEQCYHWLDQRPHFDYLEVSYNEMVSEPEKNLSTINDFLGGRLDIAEMQGIIEPSLYRNRA